MAFVITIGLIAYSYFSNQHTSKCCSYSINNLDTNQTTRVEAALRQLADSNSISLRKVENNANITFNSPPDEKGEVIAQETSATPQPIVSSTILTPSINNSISVQITGSAERYKYELIEKSKTALNNQQNKRWKYLALGDIIPARDVYTAMRVRNDFVYPYAKIFERSKQADLTVSNVETTIADGQNYQEGVNIMNFTAPARALDGIIDSGIDGVNLANNHSSNGGSQKFAEMMNLLTAKGIGYFGAGLNSAESNKPWVTKVKDISIAHLGYNSVPGLIPPTASTAGGNTIAVAPWGSLQPQQVASVATEIKEAKNSNDVVIVWFQWGTEYTHQANEDQRALAHAAIDAGADVVIATHPHWTQGVEWYKDHLIAYSLGNFVFDQNWSEETRRSVALELEFEQNNVVGAELLPIHIENLVQPRFLDPTETTYQQILHDVSNNSWWPVR